MHIKEGEMKELQRFNWYKNRVGEEEEKNHSPIRRLSNHGCFTCFFFDYMVYLVGSFRCIVALSYNFFFCHLKKKRKEKHVK